MRLWTDKPRPDDEVDDAERELKRLTGDLSERREPSPGYWGNLIIKTNERIDGATSGKALSISWTFRVALPGVIAVLAFIVGLHYFVPRQADDAASLVNVVAKLPTESADSIYLANIGITDEERDEILSPASVPREQVVDYYVQTADPEAIMETLSDTQATDLLAALRTEDRQ
jgi:hypothetical protein